MLTLALYLVAGLAGAEIEVHAAPDQPAPIVFTDEPLLLEITGTDGLRSSASVYALGPDGVGITQTINLPPAEGFAPRWVVVDLPALRGAFGIYTTLIDGDDEQRHDASVVRVDRPLPGQASTIGLAIDTWSRRSAYGARCLPAALVRFDLDSPQLAQTLREAGRLVSCPVYVRISANKLDAGTRLRTLAAEASDRVDVWEFADVSSPSDFWALAGTLRDAAQKATLALHVTRPQDIPAYLTGDPPVIPDVLVFTPEAAGIDAYIRVVQRCGYERFPLMLDESQSTAPSLAQRQWRDLLAPPAQAASCTVLPQHSLETASGFTPAYAAAAWLGSAVADATRLGAFTSGGPPAWLLRLPPGSTAGEWMFATLPEAGAGEPRTIDPGDAAEVEVLDEFGNPLDREPGHERTIVLPAGQLRFVRGRGGDLVRRQLVARVHAGAEALLADETFARSLTPEAAGALDAMKEYAYPNPLRFEFFALLRSLPPLEDAWHRGALDTRVAVPLVAQIAGIARDLAALEEDLGEPFLEPLDKTLAGCRDWLERYSVPEVESTPLREARIRFLHDEVQRLIGEALAWDEAGRSSEAKAVAALAEWRARCLEPAATTRPAPPAPEEVQGDTTPDESEDGAIQDSDKQEDA